LLASAERKQTGLFGFASLKPYVSLLRGQLRNLILILVLMLISTSITLAIPLFAGRFVDALSGGDAPAIRRNQLFILAGLLVAQLAASFVYQVVSARLGLHTVTRLRRRIYSHLLELPSLFFSSQKAGDISSRVTSDVGSIQYMLTSGLVSFLRALITLIGALILMLQLSPRLTLVVLVLIPATIGLVRIFGGRLRKLSRAMYDELGKITSQVQETVGGIRTLKVFNAQTHESRRFQDMIESYERAGMRRAWHSAAFESGIQMSLWICLLGVVIYGFALTARGQASGGELVAFLLLAFRVAMPLASLGNLFASGQGAIAAAERLDDILALPTERLPGTPAPTPIHDPASLELKNLSFSYSEVPEEDPVLKNLSFAIEPGQWVGIVGPSGSGKTTLAGLLLGLFPPDSGSIQLNGRSYSDFGLAELRSRMAWVAQDPLLYDLSLTENIRFGLTTASEEEVRDAASKAEVLEFANRMPDGMDTSCGERGARLSGGQRQRVALARAFLRNPGLLILDEPTSALDAASEDSINRAMKSVMAGRTAVVIAHRFSLVRDLDLILVMADGKVMQSGSHAELMDQDGLYRTLYQLQQGGDR
jgi:ABC-type multidrug transport system fused ATPase/permease subunit